MTDPVINNFKSYLGNPLLKKSGVEVNWTPEIVEEYMKCSKDVIYFVEKYMKIINVDKGLIPFHPYDYQRDMLRSMADERYTIIGTARQAGKCFCINTPIRIRNKKTGQILETTIGEFYEMQSMRQTIQSKT
jgi:hypothetical protein